MVAASLCGGLSGAAAAALTLRGVLEYFSQGHGGDPAAPSDGLTSMSQMAGMLLVAAPLAMVAFGVVCGTMQYAILHKVANLNGKHLVLGIGIAGLASPLVLVLGGPVTGLLRTVVPATAADLITLGVLSLLLGFATTQFVLALGPAKSEV